jgi:hypothetical protein
MTTLPGERRRAAMSLHPEPANTVRSLEVFAEHRNLTTIAASICWCREKGKSLGFQ